MNPAQHKNFKILDKKTLSKLFGSGHIKKIHVYWM